MQLKTTNSWKSKNHGTVVPRLMLAIGLATLAGLNGGCSTQGSSAGGSERSGGYLQAIGRQ